MTRLEIAVPDMNDSFSRVVLDGTQYLIRFAWNDTVQRWGFGLYSILREPLIEGQRMVPRFPLNLQIIDERLPSGIFGIYTDLASVGRNDFLSGRAIFAYISAEEVSR
jgi:hypothetical protein